MKYSVCLCGKDAPIKFKLKSEVYYCNSCKLYFAPNVKFNMDFQSTLDEDVRVKALKELRTSNFQKIIKEISNYLSPQAVGLEVGSSYGWFLELAKKNNINCIGIEPEELIWKQSCEKGFNVIKGFFPNDLPNDLNNFDFIIFNDVLEHIPDVNQVLAACHKLLKDDGILIINIPLNNGVFYKLAKIFNDFGIKNFLNRLWQFDFHSPHFYYFNKISLEKILGKNSFKIINYHPLDTIHKNSVGNRINSDKNAKQYSKIVTTILTIFLPILARLNEDIGCFYVEKQFVNKKFMDNNI
jgi:2-polyprenyl-3-methyl-5-hydroxy-6-metoxy-1,4-benzoquinol methylase